MTKKTACPESERQYGVLLLLAIVVSIVAATLLGKVGSTFGKYIGGGDGRVVIGHLSAAFGLLTPWVVFGLMFLKPTRKTYSILLNPRDSAAKTWSWAALTAAMWLDAAIVLGWIYRVVADWDVIKKDPVLGNIIEDDAVAGLMAVFGLIALCVASWHYRSWKMAVLLILLAIPLVIGFAVSTVSQPWPH